MSSSRKQQLGLVTALLGNYWGERLLKKLEEEIPFIRKRSDATIRECIYRIVNYIDNAKKSDYSIIDKYSINQLETFWSEWFDEYKTQYSNKNYIETNEIILDCNNGFYWILNKSFYSAEMIIRLNNCGRVPINNFFLELREYKNGYNFTHIVVVIDDNGVIHQMQGPENEKPNYIYFEYIYALLVKYKFIKSMVSTYPTENEFRLSDFTPEQIQTLKQIRPELFKIL